MLSGLKEMRLRQNLRQADLERLTRIPQPRISRIERGVQQSTDEEIERLMGAYGLKDDDKQNIYKPDTVTKK
jgi:transcriptional regulator with XRE-family HTH domain